MALRASSSDDSAEPSRTYAAGTRVPGTVYEVRKVLGAGGMGTVYEVEDTSVGKPYVLKTLHPELGDRQDLARRMQNEARTLARLQHPNIVEVVTAGVTADEMKLPFYVMERLEGQNIRVVIEKMRRLSVAHAVRITIDLLDALDRAHESGVIHRDVKPDNIFLHRAPSGSTVTKLLDFGIMRVLDGSRGDTAGRFLGTLRYAAPEQLRGETLSPQTDLYAAGLVLYEMIAGRGPFDHLADVQQIGRAHLRDVPPPLSALAPEAPPELVRLIDRALAKDATLRPRDAFTFAGELRAMQKALRAGPPSSVPTTTLATEVNVLGSIETVIEPPSAARPSARSTRRALPAHDEDVDSGATEAMAPRGARDMAFLPTEAEAHGAAARGTEASAPPVMLDTGEVHLEPHVDRYAMTRTSAEDARVFGAGGGASSGAGDTEAFALPPRPRIVSPPVAAPREGAEVIAADMARPSVPANPAGAGRDDPTVRKRRTTRLVGGAAAAMALVGLSALAASLLPARRVTPASAAAASASAIPSASTVPAATPVVTASATADLAPSSSAPASDAPAAVQPVASAPSAAAHAPVHATPPKVSAPRPPPHALAGPPHVSAGF